VREGRNSKRKLSSVVGFLKVEILMQRNLEAKQKMGLFVIYLSLVI
jgi:hypothetical protein